MIHRSATALCAALMLVACGKAADKAAEGETTAPAESASTAPPAAGEQPAAKVANFDLSKVPVSTAPLGAFPYLAPPSGYKVRDEKTMDLAAFPIFNGAAFQTVEGKVYMAKSDVVDDKKTYSRLEFERGVENAVKAIGGVQIYRGEADSSLVDTIPSETKSDMNLGLGSIYGNPITTYVVRRADKTIWIHLTTTGSEATWAVVDGPAAP